MDDWQKKWMANRMADPMGNTLSKVSGTPLTTPQSQNGEVDIGQLLQQRMMSRHPGMAFPNPPQRQGPQEVTLKEGHEFWKELSFSGMSVNACLVRKSGIIPSNMVGKKMIVRSEKNCFEVTNEAVDLNNLPMDTHQVLIEVEAPWIGRFLVRREALSSTPFTVQNNNGRRLLND